MPVTVTKADFHMSMERELSEYLFLYLFLLKWYLIKMQNLVCVVPAVKQQRQEDFKFETSLGYRASSRKFRLDREALNQTAKVLDK